MQYIVEQLQSPVQRDLHPARRLLDALPAIVWAPALHKAESQDAESTKIVYSNTLCHVGLDPNIAPGHVPWERGNVSSVGVVVVWVVWGT